MKTNKTLKGLALTATTLLAATQIMAQVASVTQIPGYFYDSGEFNVTPVIGTGYGGGALVNGGFETFCTYRDTGIPIPGTFYYLVDTNGVYPPFNDTISKGTALLYSQFASNALTGYRYAGFATPDAGNPLVTERTTDANNLQLAIWVLEGQYWYGGGDMNPFSANSLNGDLLNPWVTRAANAFGGGTNGLLAAMTANSPGGYNVGVLDLNTINPNLSIGSGVQPLLVLLNQTVTPPRTNYLGHGDTATIGFWHNKNGQALIKAMPHSPALGNWLAGNFPCLYGNLAGKSNSDVAAQFMVYFNVTGQKTYAQVLAGALAAYVTDSDLAGNAAANYGFNVSPSGTGAKLYNVGSLGTTLGLQNNTSYTIMELLQAANAKCPWNVSVFNALNTIFDGINTGGDI